MPINTTLFLPFIVVGVCVASLPGPTLLYTVSQSAFFGFRHALPPMLGVLLGSVIYGFFTMVAGQMLLSQQAELLSLLNDVGAVYLIVFGSRCVYISFKQSSAILLIDNIGHKKNFLNGLVIALSNPKILFFYIIIIPQFIEPRLGYPQQMGLLVSTQIFIKAMVLLGYAWIASRVGRTGLVKLNTQRIRIYHGLTLAFIGSMMLLIR